MNDARERPETPELSDAQARAVDLLVAGQSRAAVARAVKVDPKTVWRWSREPSFVAALERSRRQLHEKIVAAVEGEALGAVGTLRKVMRSPRTPAAAKVSAAKALLTLALKGRDDADHDDDSPVAMAEDLEAVADERLDELLRDLLARAPQNAPGAPQTPGGAEVAPPQSRDVLDASRAPERPRPRPTLRPVPRDPTDFGDLGPVVACPDDAEPEPVKGDSRGGSCEVI